MAEQASASGQNVPDKGAGAVILSMGVTVWVGKPHFYQGRGVVCELNLVNARGVMMVIAMNFLRTTHLGMAKLGHQCSCNEAIELVDYIAGATQVLAGGAMTDQDWGAVAEIVYGAMDDRARDACRREITAITITQQHTASPLVGIRLPT